MRAMNDGPVIPGQILAGKYRIERVLGAGAMGMVLAATHLALGTRVAIKIMLGGGRRGDELAARFLREARVAAMLRSQHAGKVLDLGTTEDGAPYIVMEYLDGEDLVSRLAARGPLPVEEAVGYILQACEAIAEAHGLGIVHRDIKPANLFLTTGVDGAPCMKVVDFGVAKQNDSDLALTRTGQAIGSPLYMSPEQMNGSRDVDGRADIWSLGVTLYEMIAGTTPFFADTLTELCARVHLGWPTPITEYRNDVPAGLEAVLMQCFEKRRERRWPNVAALAAALAPYASERTRIYAERVASVAKVDVPESRPTTELPQPTDTALIAAAMRTPAALAGSVMRAPHRSPRGWGLPVVGVVLAVGLPAALYVGLRSRTPKPEPTVPMIVPVSTAIDAPPTSTAIESPAPSALPAMPSATTPATATAPAPAKPTSSPPPRKTPAAKPPDEMPAGGRR